jgi:ankyrin repeat protein
MKIFKFVSAILVLLNVLLWGGCAGQGETPLIRASQRGNLAQANLLLKNGVAVNSKNKNGVSALLMAATFGYPKICKILISNGANINIKDNLVGFSPLTQAVFNNYIAIVELLLIHKADTGITDHKGFTPLMWAAIKGHIKIVKLLIDNNADIKFKTNKGDTALAFAIYKGHYEIVKFLLKNGDNVNSERKDGFSYIALAVAHNKPKIVDLLIKRGAEVNHKGPGTALFLATVDSNLKIVKLLLAAKADPGITSTYLKATPLILASAHGDMEIVKLLIKAGADVNAQANNGWTSLIGATTYGHKDVIKLLLQNGANINIAEEAGNTPVKIAKDIVKAKKINTKKRTDFTKGLDTTNASLETYIEIVAILRAAKRKQNITKEI